MRGDRGAGLVAGIALIFAFTFLGLVWLARDVDRGVSNRSAAQSIAFQAARSGAQSAAVTDLRSGSTLIDPAAATSAATATAGALFASYGVDGSVTSVEVADGQRVGDGVDRRRRTHGHRCRHGSSGAGAVSGVSLLAVTHPTGGVAGAGHIEPKGQEGT